MARLQAPSLKKSHHGKDSPKVEINKTAEGRVKKDQKKKINAADLPSFLKKPHKGEIEQAVTGAGDKNALVNLIESSNGAQSPPDERDKEIARWKEQIAELTKQNAELTKSNLNFHKYLGGQDTEIARLKKENGSLEKKVGGLERKIGGLEKKNGQLERDLKQIKVWHHDTLIANKQYVAEDARKTTKTLREPRPNC